VNKNTQPTDLKNLDQHQLIEMAKSLDQPSFRGRQIFAWLYRPKIISFSQMTDLAKEFRKLLNDQAIVSYLSPIDIESSRDGAVKFAFRLNDDLIIESVLIPDEDRNTLCVSSQVGCAMGCTFCLTGKMGFKRNLSTSEIVNQVCAVRDWMLENGKEKINNLVFMGMGEPLANLDNLLCALSILTDQKGLDMASRRITVSTCGLIPQMIKLGRLTDVNLAVSLHAPDNETRSNLMPINNKYPISSLISACLEFPMKKRQRIMFEYTLFEGINDSDEKAVDLALLLKGIPCKINLIEHNQIECREFKKPSRDKIIRFQQILRSYGYSVFIRQSRGKDISAACGQLAGRIGNI